MSACAHGNLRQVQKKSEKPPIFLHPDRSHSSLYVESPLRPRFELDRRRTISAGNFHCLALDKDGYVWGWGDNRYGQLGNGESQEFRTKPVRVKKDASNFLDNIVYIDAGYKHSTAIDKYGNFWVWGSNEFGQLGLGNTNNKSYATIVP